MSAKDRSWAARRRGERGTRAETRARAGETGSECQRGDGRARADRRTHRSRLPRDASGHHRGRRAQLRRGLAQRASRETHRRTSRHRARGRGGAMWRPPCQERLQSVRATIERADEFDRPKPRGRAIWDFSWFANLRIRPISGFIAKTPRWCYAPALVYRAVERAR